MAVQIPTIDGPGQRTRPMSAPQVQVAAEESLGADLARPLANAATQIWQKTQDDADTAALMEAESSLSQWQTNTLFNQENGVYTKKGKNAIDITNQTLPQFQAHADSIANNLTNDRQRQRFAQIAAAQGARLNGELNRYEYGERQVFYKQAEDATLDAATQSAVAFYNNPQQVAFYQNKGTRTITAMGERNGEAPELTQQKVLKYNSGINTAVIGRLMQDDPLAAQRHYAQSYETMTPEDQVQVTKLLGDSVRQQLGSQIGESAYNFGTVGTNGVIPLIVQAETGGDPTAVSPKGALGLMQLMPATAEEVAKEMGVPYSKERLLADPQYNMSIGTYHYNKLLGYYGGSNTLAVAAYNGGQGSVDKWIKANGDPRTGEISDQDWINKIPFKETRNYTSKIVSQLAPSGAASKLAAATQAVQQIKDPETRKYAMDRIDDLNKADQLVIKANYEQAADIALSQGYNAIPPTVLANIGAEDRVKLQALDEHRRKGTEPETDEPKLREFLSMPGPQFAELSLQRDIRPFLNNADYNTVKSSWQKAVQGDYSDQRATKAENDQLQTVMQQAGILFGDSLKATAPANLKAQNQFRAAYQGQKDAFFLSNGRNPTAKESADIANSLVTEVRLRGTGVISEKLLPLWQVAPEQMQNAYLKTQDVGLDEIPAEDRAKIVRTLRAQGQPASVENIVGLYVQGISNLGVKAQ